MIVVGYKSDKLRIIDSLYDLIETVADYEPGDIISLWDIQLIMQDIQELNKKGE